MIEGESAPASYLARPSSGRRGRTTSSQRTVGLSLLVIFTRATEVRQAEPGSLITQEDRARGGTATTPALASTLAGIWASWWKRALHGKRRDAAGGGMVSGVVLLLARAATHSDIARHDSADVTVREPGHRLVHTFDAGTGPAGPQRGRGGVVPEGGTGRTPRLVHGGLIKATTPTRVKSSATGQGLLDRFAGAAESGVAVPRRELRARVAREVVPVTRLKASDVPVPNWPSSRSTVPGKPLRNRCSCLPSSVITFGAKRRMGPFGFGTLPTTIRFFSAIRRSRTATPHWAETAVGDHLPSATYFPRL